MLLFLGCTKCPSVAKGAVESNLLHCLIWIWVGTAKPAETNAFLPSNVDSCHPTQEQNCACCAFIKIKAPRCLLRKFKIIYAVHIGKLQDRSTQLRHHIRCCLRFVSKAEVDLFLNLLSCNTGRPPSSGSLNTTSLLGGHASCGSFLLWGSSFRRRRCLLRCLLLLGALLCRLGRGQADDS